MNLVRTTYLGKAALLSHLEALAIIHMAMRIVGAAERTAEEDPPTTKDLNQKTDPS